jgi:hypothetical protein
VGLIGTVATGAEWGKLPSRPSASWAGATPRTFGRFKAKKVGSLPPVLVIVLPALSETDISTCFSLSQMERTRVKKLVQTRVQKEFLTFFTMQAG